jgi:hypothetical protein
MAVFPTFHHGVVTQMPYVENLTRFRVTQAYTPSGFAFTTIWNPTTPEARFGVRFDMMEKDELDLLEAFWVTIGGPAGSFSFTDDAGTTYNDCSFEAQNIDFRYIQAGQYASALTFVARAVGSVQVNGVAVPAGPLQVNGVLVSASTLTVNGA